MWKTVRKKMIAAGLALALTANGSNAQELPPPLEPAAPQEPVSPQGQGVPQDQAEPQEQNGPPSETAPQEQVLPQAEVPPAVPRVSQPTPAPAAHHVSSAPACAPACAPSCAPGRRAEGQGWRYCLQDRFLGYPHEFEAPPLGHFVNLHIAVQTSNGVAARMMLYDYDFECGSDRLNIYGKDRLRNMGHWLVTTPFPLIVERTPRRPGLAEARGLAVFRELAAMGVNIAPERLLVGPSAPGQLTGVEAEVLYHNLLQQTQNRGAWPPGQFGPPNGAGSSGASGSH